MNPESVVRTYWDHIFVGRDLDALDNLVTDPSIRHTADGTRSFTPSELKEHLRDALCAFRTDKLSIEALTVDGDNVWMRANVHAVSLATMTPINFAWIAQYRVEGDRISITNAGAPSMPRSVTRSAWCASRKSRSGCRMS